MGTNDLAKETRARQVPGRAPMLPWLATCVLAAREYGIDILDGVYNDISNADGFAQECAQASDLGFDGKTLIHPNQIEPCNAAFSPTPDEVAQARKMIAAFDLPENKGKGVVQIDGRMVERMHAEMARRTVAIAEAIGAAKDSRESVLKLRGGVRAGADAHESATSPRRAKVRRGTRIRALGRDPTRGREEGPHIQGRAAAAFSS